MRAIFLRWEGSERSGKDNLYVRSRVPTGLELLINEFLHALYTEKET
jgi:hypothetical protein